jgi:predicted flap endonuclease-1-like 5' DNA nuclease
MNERSLTRRNPILIGVIGFILGLTLGLVIGWYLWPVNWENVPAENVDEATRVDFLRAAIDSYTYKQDVALATERYNSLGKYKESTLYFVYAESSGQSQTAIAAFAAAVKASEALKGTPPTPAAATTPNILGSIPVYLLLGLCILALFLIALVVIFVILRRRNRSAKVVEMPVEETPAVIEQPTAEEPSPELTAPADYVAATYTPYTPPVAEPVPTDEAKTVPLEETEIPPAPKFFAPAPAAPPPPTLDKFSQPIEDVQGIGPDYGQKLREIGIVAPLLLLKNGASGKGRHEIAEKTGISEELILNWVHHVDLFRIKGLAQEYADLLGATGIDNMAALAQCNPQALHEMLVEVNRGVYEPPTLAQVEGWVAQAKKLPRAVTY